MFGFRKLLGELAFNRRRVMDIRDVSMWGSTLLLILLPNLCHSPAMAGQIASLTTVTNILRPGFIAEKMVENCSK